MTSRLDFLMLLGPQITAFDQLGVIQPRSGNRSVNNAPRNLLRCCGTAGSPTGRWSRRPIV